MNIGQVFQNDGDLISVGPSDVGHSVDMTVNDVFQLLSSFPVGRPFFVHEQIGQRTSLARLVRTADEMRLFQQDRYSLPILEGGFNGYRVPFVFSDKKSSVDGGLAVPCSFRSDYFDRYVIGDEHEAFIIKGNNVLKLSMNEQVAIPYRQLLKRTN